MKNVFILMGIIALVGFTSCGDDDNNKKEELGIPVSFGEVKKIKSLYAPSSKDSKGWLPSTQKGEFVKFNFRTGKVTKSETDWDIAFRYATILVNGGAKRVSNDADEPKRTGNVGVYISENIFEDVKNIDEKKFKQDAEGALAITDDVQNHKGIWSYSMETHIVSAIPGRILVFKIGKGEYVKMEVLSFYKDEVKPNKGDLRYGYYTFRYSIGKVKIFSDIK